MREFLDSVERVDADRLLELFNSDASRLPERFLLRDCAKRDKASDLDRQLLDHEKHYSRVMAQNPADEAHAAQILAGTAGRDYGHRFEERLANQLEAVGQIGFVASEQQCHIVHGWPAVELLAFVVRELGIEELDTVAAWWVGGLATGAGGVKSLGNTGVLVPRSKSDVVIGVTSGGDQHLVGVGVKTCNNKQPTNAQLYFSTAVSFCQLLRSRGLSVSEEAEEAMRMFCGDAGFRPEDVVANKARMADPSRWFWEELPESGRAEMEAIFSDCQDEVTEALLAHAYDDDPIPPRFILHQRFKASAESDVPLAIYTVPQLVRYSAQFGGFSTRPYRISKGRFKDDPSTHYAPRFGFVQMQRGGQAQHPTQLQFNLKAGYFNKAPQAPPG